MTAYKLQKQHASNYNYTTRKSLGQKIKKLFTIPEEDLKEEESPKFEKIKLFRLNRGIIFLSILAFMLIVNLLIVFDVNFLYLRPILGFLFLILVPGLLIMLCFKIRTVKFWEYLVYTIGLSIAFIMFAGLAVNWTLPALNITDKPLSLLPILICFNIFLLILWTIAIIRNKDLKAFDVTIPKLDATNKIFFIIPMAFPLLSILGAFLLNNNGPNILTIIMLGGIAIYVLLLVIFRKKMNENVWPWAILMISLALLLSFSMRSWFPLGFDINQEQYVFRLTFENQFWSMSHYNNAYSSCLSLSILPDIMSLFLKVDISIIFKLLVQIIFIFHPISIYLIFNKRILRSFAFMASFLYFGAGYYNHIFTTVVRQEIALLFFGLMLLVLFSKEINPILKKVLFVIFGVSMIVSHYSTSYIVLALFTLTYICNLIYKTRESRKIKRGKLHPSQKSEFYLTGFLIILLLLFGFLWLTQLTDTSNGIISTAKITYKNIGSTFSDDLKTFVLKESLFQGITSTRAYTNQDLNEYINVAKSLLGNSNVYTSQELKSYNPFVFQREIIPSKSYFLTKLFFYSYLFTKYALILSFAFGLIFILFLKNKNIPREFSFMVALSVLMMFLMIILPYVSKAYNFERLLQQSLIFLSFSSICFFYIIFKKKVNITNWVICFLYLNYCLFNLGLFISLGGGGVPGSNLYNKGADYNSLYLHISEDISINWINNINTKETIYLDPFSDLKFYSHGDPFGNKSLRVIPQLMTSRSYVYSSYANKIKKINFLDDRKIFNVGTLYFNYPTEFLQDNKNKIYNNGGSEIFK